MLGTLWIIGRVVMVLLGIVVYITSNTKQDEIRRSFSWEIGYYKGNIRFYSSEYMKDHCTKRLEEAEKRLEDALSEVNPAKRRLIGLAMVLFSEVALLVLMFKGLMWLLDKAYKGVQWVGDQTKDFFKQLRSDINEVLGEDK